MWILEAGNMVSEARLLVEGVKSSGLFTRFWSFFLDLSHFAWIWAIILGFEPFCLDLGHIPWIGAIWAIWQNLGQNRPQRRQSPEDGAGGTGGWMGRWTDGNVL